MSDEIKPKRMKPVIILPEGMMSKADKSRLNANDFCVVECKDPSLVRFQEPPPLGYSAQEKAAIQLCRWILSHTLGSTSFNKQELSAKLAEIFIHGSQLEPIRQVQPVKKV